MKRRWARVSLLAALAMPLALGPAALAQAPQDDGGSASDDGKPVEDAKPSDDAKSPDDAEAPRTGAGTENKGGPVGDMPMIDVKVVSPEAAKPSGGDVSSPTDAPKPKPRRKTVKAARAKKKKSPAPVPEAPKKDAVPPPAPPPPAPPLPAVPLTPVEPVNP